VDLPCTTCHDTPTRHKVTPLVVRAEKPAERTFCAQCHDSAKPKIEGAPQIQLDAHYPRYLCWQCHYPHYPET
jgi:ribosomal protein S27AE